MAYRDLTKKEVAKLIEALWFYANPDTYFAATLFVDPPCGDIRKDYSKIDGRYRLGKRARRTLLKLKLMEPL